MRSAICILPILLLLFVFGSKPSHSDGVWYRAGDCSSSSCYEYFAAAKTVSKAKKIMNEHDECQAVGCQVLLECQNMGWFSQVMDQSDSSVDYTAAYPAAFGISCGYSSKTEAKSDAKRICQQRGGRYCDYIRRVGHDDGSSGIKGMPE